MNIYDGEWFTKKLFNLIIAILTVNMTIYYLCIYFLAH